MKSKKEGRGKIKVEKMGEEKEWFLEKMGGVLLNFN